MDDAMDTRRQRAAMAAMLGRAQVVARRGVKRFILWRFEKATWMRVNGGSLRRFSWRPAESRFGLIFTRTRAER